MRVIHPVFGPRGIHLVALDTATALLVTVVHLGFAGGGFGDGQPVFTGPVWAGRLLAFCVGLPLALRRYRPVPVLAVVTAASAVATLLDVTREPWIPVALATYLVALTHPVRRSGTALAAVLTAAAATVGIGVAVLTPSGTPMEAVGTAALVWLCVGTAWATGYVVRSRRLEAARRERLRADHALTEERLRIARELHDVVSHSLGLIVVRAGVGGHVAEEHPGEARAALHLIEVTGREALTEMRRALGVLRSNPGDRGTDEVPLGPSPGLEDLPELVHRAERAGIRVSLRVRVPGGLAAGAALTVHRIVQESLTNTVRHAGPGTRCRISVTADTGGAVLVSVVDDGSGPSTPSSDRYGPGYGLVGMRERAATYGGTLAAGPRPQGGFSVEAHLPGAASPTTGTDSREETPT